MSLEAGGIYRIDLDGDKKYVLVVSREELNRGNGFTSVLFTTKRLKHRATLPNCVYFSAGEFGLTEDCVAKCDDIAYTELKDVDQERGLVGKLDDWKMREVIKAIGHVIGSDCEPI